MTKRNTTDIIQAIVVTLVIAGLTFISILQTSPPGITTTSEPISDFNIERVIEHIKAISQEPRLVNTPAYDKACKYIQNKLAEFGISSEVQRTKSNGLGIYSNHFATVENVIARIEGSETRDAILLIAHLDTTPFSPGASDDGHGVAILLEIAQILQTNSSLNNTVILLFASSEETYLQGSLAFITEHRWAKDVKLVINLDTGGLSGPSLLIKTSPESGWLIQEYAKADSYAAGSSAIEFFRNLESDFTDFDVFIAAGISGYDFNYTFDRLEHTPLDNIGNLDLSSIQHQGYHVLSLVRHFGNLNLEDPKEPNPIYFNVLRQLLIQYPRSWAIPIMLVVTLTFITLVIIGFKRQYLNYSGIGFGALVFVISLVTVALLVRLLWWVITNNFAMYQSPLNGHPYNESLLGITFISVTVALVATWYVLIKKFKSVSIPNITIGTLSLLCICMVVSSIAFPETSFIFTWPLLFSILATGYWFLSMNEDNESFSIYQIAGFLIAALTGIVLLVPAVFISFKGLDTELSFISMVWIVILLGLFIPLLYIIVKPYKWWLPIMAGLLALGSLTFALIDDFDKTMPQHSTAFYILNHDTGEAYWGGGIPGSNAKLDDWTAQFFSGDVQRRLIPGSPFNQPFFLTTAPVISLPPPSAEMISESISGDIRTIQLHLSSPRNAPSMVAYVEPELDIISVEVDGIFSEPLSNVKESGQPFLLFRYVDPPREGFDVVVKVRVENPFGFILIDSTYGLPDVLSLSVKPMPDHIIPYPYGLSNRTIVMKPFTFVGGVE